MRKRNDSEVVNIAEPRLVTKAVAAKLLSVSTRMVDRMADRGELTKCSLGRRAVRFRVSEILKLVGEVD